ncbi:MAG: hypothetical protein JEZ10_07510 [Verrucomicrobia bacterium]|nr:hypothetical protein [Verrucomicrobiota bacterium]
MKKQKQKNGFVMTAVLMLIVIASLIGGAFLVSAHNSFSAVDRWRDYDDCLLGMQSALEIVKYNLQEELNDEMEVEHSRASLGVLANKDFTTNVTWSSAATKVDLLVPYTVDVAVSVVSGSMVEIVAENYAEVTLTCEAVATHGGVTRRIQEVVTHTYNDTDTPGGPDNVFDYVFFIDNVGFFSGVNADFNGDVFANKDIDFKYSSIRLNGDAFAGNECLSKKLYKSLDWAAYASQGFAGIDFSERTRPAEYTDFNRSNPDTFWDQGYKEGVNFYEDQESKSMPFIGPLSEYEEYAIAAGGTVSDSSKTVAAVWGDDAGEDAGVGTNDTGCLVLIGTAANPINLGGIIVAQQDIYIKGYFTGQGTLYAGRNIHVIGNLIAVDPPTWPKPDSAPMTTATVNKGKDFLGLCAKGSLIFGNHLGLDNTYLEEPHTDSHATDETDASLGYVTHYVDGVPYFDGDYTRPDGNGSEPRTDGSLRHFYEPILSDADIAALGVSEWVGWFDAVLYANHLIAGDFDVNAVLNGGFVCRDEAVRRHGNLALNWDSRLGTRTPDGQGFYPGTPGGLPPQSDMNRLVQWTELAP